MNYKFRILWFEDDSSWYSAERKILLHGLEEHKLLLEDKRETCSDIDLNIFSDNAYDLILMDYKLAAGSTGNQAIELIRGNSILTDVLLYSSQYQDMVDACVKLSPPMDGVYYADRKRDLFETKLYRIIEKIIMRSEDIINLRGFVMDNVSDFEVRMQGILEEVWDVFEDQRESLMQKTIDLISGKEKRLGGVLESFRERRTEFLDINKDHYPLTANDRSLLIQVIIDVMVQNQKLIIPECFSELQNFSEKYNKELVVYRNKLGHCKEGETVIHVNGKEVQIDQDLHRYLREKIVKYDSVIQYLEEQIHSYAEL